MYVVSTCRAAPHPVSKEFLKIFVIRFLNISETALGVCLDDRLDGDEYRQRITEVEVSLLERLKNPLMGFDCIYYNCREGRKYLKSMDKLHAFSSGIIEKRRELLSKEMLEQENNKFEQNENK